MRKEDFTASDKMTELRLDMRHPKSKGIVFVLLEGNSDVRLYRKLFRQDTCKIEEVPGGKIKLGEILSELSNAFKLIIGIRDADFLFLENKTSPLPNLFLTDYHDLEIMLIASDTAFSALVHEFVPIHKQEEHSLLKMKFLKAIRFLSYLRWYNEINNCELNFKGLNLGNIFDKNTFTIDKVLLLDKIRRLSSHAEIKGNADVLSDIEDIEDEQHDLLQLSNGHDLMKIMSYYFSSLNKKGINDTDLSSLLRVAFSLEDFRSTQLYEDTYQWAESNKCLIHC